MKCHALILALLSTAAFAAGDDRVAFFEANIRPLLAERCYECHSAEKGQSKGGLTLDTRDGWMKGGDTGAAIVPGKPDESLLIKAVRYTDADLSMPPKKKGGKLPAGTIAKLEKWVAMGAPDPREGTVKKMSGLTPEARAHWAFQIPKSIAPLKTRTDGWTQTWIDSFVLAKLEAAGLPPARPAAPDALLRRMYYDMLGLPPTVEQIDAFTRDWQAAGADAKQRQTVIERAVDALLRSPHYGERWGRHWLDTARYSDTRGLVSIGAQYRFEDYRYMYAWTYRDYVIAALNDDKPYDQFIVEQLAADQLPDIQPNDDRLAALGFVTLGRKFDNPHDGIDEQIDATTKAFLGLTVSCARCHDHKFDPVPIADYYSLHGIFASTEGTLNRPELRNRARPEEIADYEAKLAALQAEGVRKLLTHLRDRTEEFFTHAAGILMMKTQPTNSPERFDMAKRYGLEESPEIMNSMRLAPEHPVFGPFAALAEIKAEGAAWKEQAAVVLRDALARKGANPLIVAALRDLKPASLDEVAARYAKFFKTLEPSVAPFWQARLTPHARDTVSAEVAQSVQCIYAVPHCEEFKRPEDQIEFFTTAKFNEPWQRVMGATGAIDAHRTTPAINELRLTHPGAPGCAMICRDVAEPRDSAVFLRGDQHKAGALVPRRFLECLSRGDRAPFHEGSGRYELARLIASRDNPLTARVAVNRIWMHHFGEGFVRTPDDLGNMSELPSHPELLDTLAVWFMENGWSLKKLHKLILMSAAYQQSANPNDNALVARAGQTDADNRLLWRANLRRLDFESIRDSLLLLTGKLDPALGGKPANITDEPFSYRRSVYGYVDRLFLSDLPTQFDFADAMMPTSRRFSTIVPQQALFFMNNPLTVDVARHVIARPDVVAAGSDGDKLALLYRILFQRAPSAAEVSHAFAFLASVARLPEPKIEIAPIAEVKSSDGNRKRAMLRNEGERVERGPLAPWELLVQAMLCANEFVYVN